MALRRNAGYEALLNAGRLKDFVPFELHTFALNAEGQNVGTWSAAFSDWCEVQRHTEQHCRFILRYRTDITPASHRMLWFGAIWTITDVVPDLRKTALIIDSDFSALVEVTTLQSVVREYISELPVLRPPE